MKWSFTLTIVYGRNAGLTSLCRFQNERLLYLFCDSSEKQQGEKAAIRRSRDMHKRHRMKPTIAASGVQVILCTGSEPNQNAFPVGRAFAVFCMHPR